MADRPGQLRISGAAASEAGGSAGESPAGRIGWFTTEHIANCRPARGEGKQAVNEPAGCNESEPQSMSLENDRPGDKPSPYPKGEGRRAQSRQPSASGQNSGGVSVDSTPGSDARVSWESCGGGKAQASAQAGRTGKAGEVTAAVGDLHSSAAARREVTCSMRKSGSGGLRMAGANRI